jgi:CRISPR system Cascade subunit CasC
LGGALRGRISSQCLKRSIRYSDVFKSFDDDGLLGKRTQTLPSLVNEKLSEMKVEEKTIAAILSRLPDVVRGKTKAERGEESEEGEHEEQMGESEESATTDDTKQLVFLDLTTELIPFAERLHKAYIEIGAGKWAKAKLNEINKHLGESLPRSVDIAMFGRMTTAQAFKNVQAAVQVAHALSTNALKQEFDYYTAMDDLKPDSEPGADMIGDIEFNSCTYYKYLNVHWEELVANLGGDKDVAQRAVLALLEAAAMAHPTGKQNGFGAFNLPDFVLVEVSDRNLPVSYANAFLKPVSGFGEKSLMANSVKQMSEYVAKLSRAYNLQPQRAYLVVDDLSFLDLKSKGSLGDLKEWLSPQLT